MTRRPRPLAWRRVIRCRVPARSDLVDRRRIESRVERQRQHLARTPASATGHSAGCLAGHRGLMRNRDRVVDQRVDALGAKVRLDSSRAAVRIGKEVIDVAGVALAAAR